MSDGARPVQSGFIGRRGWYRGVKLQKPFAAPRTPLARLQKAVTNAVRKNYPESRG